MNIDYWLSYEDTPASYLQRDEAEQAFLTPSPKPIHTPSASQWSDITLYDGAGSDEGDTYRYKCPACRCSFAGIDEVASHLLTSDMHTVCPICLKEFVADTTAEMDGFRQVHLLHSHADVLGPGNGQHGQNHQRRDQDFRTVSQETVDLAQSIGLDQLQFIEQPQTPRVDVNTNDDTESEDRTPVPVRAELHRPDQTRGLSPATENSVNVQAKGDAKVPHVNSVVEYADAAAGMLVVYNEPYWHWEPDMVKVELENIDVDRMIAERDLEMNWLKAFEGA